MVVMNSVSGASKTMANANAMISATDTMQTMKDFEKEKMKAEMKQDIMTDAMDLGDEVDDEADDVYNQICGEIGMDVSVAKPGTGIVEGPKVVVQQQNDEEFDDLEARMAALQ